MDHLTSRAQRLIEEFEEGESVRHGIAKVLMHLAYSVDWLVCESEGENMVAVPVSTLDELAEELTAPSLLNRALLGDKGAARQFLFEAGFTDEHGQLRPPYRPEDLDD
jgi:hypothetical protein